ncbi:MAG: hypothetical protein KI785_05670 [Devosiaceae bacterium]|nr:hypothetical protein [Devosiaceae bacterium MH13]
MRRSLAPSLIFAAALPLAGCVSSMQSPLGWYPVHGGNAPQNLRLTICHGFGCARSTQVQLTERDVAALRRLMARGAGNPSAERAAIAEAVKWVERRVGPIVGSDEDVGGLDLHNAGVPGQMDCLDETTNTTSTLLLLAQYDLLQHHTVAYPVARGFFLDGRYPHATAVVAETASGTRWAIDPWPYANGADVDVMPLDAWYAVWPSSS